MKTINDVQVTDFASVTETSLSIGMLVAFGVFLGSMVLRHADLPFSHLVTLGVHGLSTVAA